MLYTSKKAPDRTITLVAVVVSYNRSDLVVKTLAGINNGTVRPAHLIVVDNGSDHRCVETVRNFLKDRLHPDITGELIELKNNTGGAGGFTVGIDRAVSWYDADLVWVMDDDTEPLPDSLQYLVAPWHHYAPGLHIRPSFVASKVVWTDGRNHPMNTPRRRPYAQEKDIKRAQKSNATAVRSASFVSLLLDGQAVREQGLPIADYFLWNDDFEYSARLARFGVGLYAPRSVVKHHTKEYGSITKNPGERFAWEIRNKIWMFRYSQALNPQEKIFYGGASLLRWIRTVIRAQDKKLMLRTVRRGLKEGIFGAPRSNAVVLEGIYELGGPSKISGSATVKKPEFRNRERNSGIVKAQEKWEAREDFSVLMPYYENDTVENLKRALDSVSVGQNLPPKEIILVQDGWVSSKLEHFVKQYKRKSRIPIKIVILKKNQGVAKALDRGLAKTSYEIVARMDSDDISVPERFERQLESVAQGYDLVGSDVIEFMTDARGREIDVAMRRMPCSREEIIKTSHFKSPFNHPTVMYRKSVVEKAGGYRALKMMEDYWLFTRMIASGAKIKNIPEALVRYRIDDGAYKRRGGIKMMVSELRLQSKLLAEGYNSPWVFLRNIVVRGGYRMVPEKLRKKLYSKFFVLRK